MLLGLPADTFVFELEKTSSLTMKRISWALCWTTPSPSSGYGTTLLSSGEEKMPSSGGWRRQLLGIKADLARWREATTDGVAGAGDVAGARHR